MQLKLSPFGQIVWEDRYALKDEKGNLLEKNISENFRRVAKFIASREKNSQKWEDKFFEIMSQKYFCPAGRVLAHSGTHYSQLLNCFVLPFEEDSLESILDTAKKMAIIFKYGGGCGFNYSKLRPAGSYVKGVNGRSCGVIGFLHMMSTISEVIEQGSRRAASLGLLEIGHPDIWEFISYKTEHNWERLRDFIEIKDEDKWRSFKFENLYKWQMYNVSVGITDEFLSAVENDEIWPLMWGGVEWELYTVVFKRAKSDGTYRSEFFYATADNDSTAIWKVRRKVPYPTIQDKFEVVSRRKIKAKEIWDQICYNAWADGCPGLINLSTAKKMHNLEYASPLTGGNPCFGGDCELETIEGYKKFKDLENKKIDIITSNGLEEAKIWKTGEKSTVKIKCNNLLELVVTPDQILMTADGQKIKAKDAKNKRLNVYKEPDKNYDLLWVKLGFIQGDGNLSRLKSLHRHKGLEINLGEKDKEIKELFNYTGKDKFYYTREYRPYFLKYGFSMETLPYRTLPENIPEDKELSFLRGLYSANGSVIKNERIALKSTCKQLIIGVSNLLKKNKIDSYITTNKPKKVKFNNGTYLCRESYDLNIGKIFDIVRFNQIIGFCQEYKNKSLINLIKKKSPYVSSVKENGIETVYDFSVNSHWGYVNGIKSHNCAEQLLPDYGSCNLLSIILCSFIKKDGTFDFESLKKVIHIAIRFADNVIDVCKFPVPEIEEKAKQERRIGLGLMGVHDTLIALKLGYDTEEGRNFIERILQFIRDEAYRASIELAKERGPFPLFDKKKYLKSGFIKTLPSEIQKAIGEFGIRNSSLLTQAPTGTISTLFNVSSGCEPWFSLKFQRNTKLGSYEDGCPSYLKWLKEHSDEPKPLYFKTSQEILPKNHVEMLLLFSKHIDSSVSKCVVKGTPIATNKGIIPIENFSDSEHKCNTFYKPSKSYRVLDENGVSRKVTAHYYGGKKHCYRIRFNNGFELTAADTHLLKTADGWKSFKELNKGDKVFYRLNPIKTECSYVPLTQPIFTIYKNQKKYKFPEVLNELFAEFLGMWLANGSLNCNSISICEKDKKVRKRIIYLFKALFGEVGSYKNKRTGVWTYFINSRILAKYFKQNYGYDCVTKKVPLEILRSPASVQKAFLSGITLGGYKYRNNLVIYEGYSKQIALSISLILSSNGIKYYLGSKKVKKGLKLKKSFNVIGYFFDKSFLNPIENHKKNYRLINKEGLSIYVPEKVRTSALTLPKCGCKDSEQRKYYYNRRNLRSSLLDKDFVKGSLLKKCGFNKGVDSNLSFLLITDKFDAGIQPVYDIEVENKHSYLINGIVSHNTVNLPNSTTVKEVSDTFLYAMKNGAKGITIFRDGCKEGVLINKDKKNIIKEAKKAVHDLQHIKEEENSEERGHFKKRGNKTYGTTYRIQMQNHNLYITANRNKENQLVEVFATVGESKKPNAYHTSGVEDSWAEGLAKMISLALRAGVDTKSIIKNLKNIPSDKPVFVTIGDCPTSELIPSPPHAIGRVIEEESNGNKTSDLNLDEDNKICTECGSVNTKPKGPNCYVCLDCGNEGCG